jgi:DNA-binding transcriptional ArsR family regulator
MVLSVERKATEAKSRLVHLSLLTLNIRLMENWRSVPIVMRGAALDYETTMILMAIIVIGAEKLLRIELEPELQTLTQRLSQNRFGKVNFSSIAAATAINRETVRRKVNDLQEAGVVVREKEGIRIAHGVIQFEVLREIIDAQLDALTRTVNQLSRLGVLLANSNHSLNG